MSDDTLSRITTWCAAEDDFEFEGNTITVAGDPPVEVQVEDGDEAIVLTHSHAAGPVPEGFAAEVQALLGGRGSMLSGEITGGEGDARVALRYPIYLDGLNRQTFLLAVRDITATADALVGLSEGAEPAPASEPEAAAEPEAEPPTQPAAEAPATEPEAEPTATETVVVDAAPWAPTHTVPGGGMPAWAEPDPALAPAAKLAARVELRVDETRGAWAKVTGSNGWTGWVDGRKLRPVGGVEPAPAGQAPTRSPATPASPLGTVRPLQALGGLAMIISAFIPWNATGQALDASYVIPVGKPLDWPLAFLWNSLSPGQPRLGMVVLLLGIALLIMAVVPRVPVAAIIGTALAGVIIGLAFLYELHLAPGWGDTFRILQTGFWVYLIGAVVAAVPLQPRQ